MPINPNELTQPLGHQTESLGWGRGISGRSAWGSLAIQEFPIGPALPCPALLLSFPPCPASPSTSMLRS